jgi:prepilin-type processing-associated H-X9-DG protein
VVIGILAVLMGILLPPLSAVRRSAQRLVCAVNMRTVSGEFESFADGTNAAGRGDSERLGPGRFHIGDFQELLYRIDEFWDQGEQKTATLLADRDAMLCPGGARTLTRKRGLPCGREALGPVGDVSMGLNLRLLRSVVDFHGKRMLAGVANSFVSSRVLNHPSVPLVMDVDGAAMEARGVDPFYLAPPIADPQDPLSSGKYWSQSKRHGRMVNVGFVGGHVLASENPAAENWDWAYHAETR